MAGEPFVRHIVFRSVNFYWRKHYAAPFLKREGWIVIHPESFSYEKSYGHDPSVFLSKWTRWNIESALRMASAVVEYHGEQPRSSAFDPNSDRTLVDDLLGFMSLYTGVYWQYLWRERRREPGSGWNAVRAMQLNYDRNNPDWAANMDEALNHFERALRVVPTIDQKQFSLAIRWFFSALGEFEVGRRLVEPALNWVALESQANYRYPESKWSDVKRVMTLLDSQGFPGIPHLRKLYGLRCNAFHKGHLLDFSESQAQKARTAGRALVRAQILNLLGMEHADFDAKFVAHYA